MIVGWYDNTRIRITRAPREEYRFLTDFCTIPEARGVTRLFRAADSSLPVGMRPLLAAECPKRGIELDLVDRRPPPSVVPLTGPALDAAVAWLRPHQRAAVDAVIRNARGIVSIPTGGGKGELIPALARAIPCRWLVGVHRSHLVDDLADRYARVFGTPPGRIGDGEWTVRHTTIASLKTLYEMRRRDPERFAQLAGMVEGLIVDEAHTTPATTHEEVITAFDRAYYQVALSATPLARLDGKNITTFAHYGPPIHTTQPAELIEAGYIAPPRIELVRVAYPPPPGLADAPDYATLYAACVADNPTRNAAVIEVTLRATKPAMVFVTDIDQGVYLTGALIRRGCRTTFVEGSTKLPERKRAIMGLATGALDVVVATPVFNEGVDVQGLRSAVLASAGKSVIAALQRIGRATRIAAGKTEAEVYDIADRGVLTFQSHASARRSAYRSQGYSAEYVDLATVLARPVQLRSVYAPAESRRAEAGSVGASPAPPGLSRTVL